MPSTIWEKMRDEEVRLDKDEIEGLFAAKVAAAKKKEEEEDVEGEGVPGAPRKKRLVILLSARRSQTIGVLLSHLKIPHDDLRKAIMSLDVNKLQTNFVVQLMKLLPTDQEIAALQSYTGPKEDLGTAERFLFELLCIPRLKPRLQCFVFILEFNARLHDLSENVEVFSYAIHDIQRCKKLVKVLEIVLAMGNYLNGQGPKGGAFGFKLEFLTKLADTKTSDNKSTLLHYLVTYIERVNKELLDFPQELSNVEIGAKVSENMVDEISKFKKEIKFIYEEMNKPYYKSNAKNDPCGSKLEQFYHTAYTDMDVLENNKKETLAMYKELSKQFGEEELKPDEYMTYIHQFAQSFKARFPASRGRLVLPISVLVLLMPSCDPSHSPHKIILDECHSQSPRVTRARRVQEAHNENVRKREEEERIKRRREDFLRQAPPPRLPPVLTGHVSSLPSY